MIAASSSVPSVEEGGGLMVQVALTQKHELHELVITNTNDYSSGIVEKVVGVEECEEYRVSTDCGPSNVRWGDFGNKNSNSYYCVCVYIHPRTAVVVGAGWMRVA